MPSEVVGSEQPFDLDELVCSPQQTDTKVIYHYLTPVAVFGAYQLSSYTHKSLELPLGNAFKAARQSRGVSTKEL